MTQYGQFCPVAKAAEILGERWTLLIVRNLLLGAIHFSELQRLLAKASPTILAKRLRHLEEAGIISRTVDARGKTVEYHLTDAGQALLPLIEQMGIWATRWVATRLARDELDEYLLMTDIQRRLKIEQLPQKSAILHLQFTGRAAHPKWWLVINDGEIDLCDEDPGYEIDLYITTSLRVMVEIWLGRRTLANARRTGKLKLAGDRALERTMHRWMGYSLFADAPKPASARSSNL